MSKVFSTEEIFRTLDDIVAERGVDYALGVGEVCKYKDESGKPLCVIGHLIARLNPEGFATINNVENTITVDALGGDVISVDSSETLEALRLIQSVQDTGNTWSEAVQTGRHSLDNLVAGE